MTYNEAYNRIITAYFKDEVKPFEPCACFIGNLLGGKDIWANARTKDPFLNMFVPAKYEIGFYGSKDSIDKGLKYIKDLSNDVLTIEDICRIENVFMKIIWGHTSKSNIGYFNDGCDQEEQLFEAMSAGLDMLKTIYEEKGLPTESIVFNKRELVNA